MSTVAEIKAAIPRLTLEEREEIARCLHDNYEFCRIDAKPH